MTKQFARKVRSDNRGSTVVEFGILAPILFGMIFGVLQLGLQMQNYNSLHAVASDAARYTVVEYQKLNRVTTAQIRTRALAMAVNAPYNLDSDKLTVTTAAAASEIAGSNKINVTLSYQMPNFLGFLGQSAPTITYQRPIYVPT